MVNNQSKSELRKIIHLALEKISPAVRAVESIGLCERLEQQLQSARTILFFSPLPDELDVWPLLEKFLASGKTCALPFFDTDKQHYGARQMKNLATEIMAGKFGVREPAPGCVEIPLEQIDLTLVPGLAFDLSGSRLGRGRGFYDRLLENIGGIKCGVAYDNIQLLEKIPAEAHDARMDFIVTPSRSVRCKPRTA